MGRITVFTADDLLSCQVKAAFEKKGLPYTEISFLQCPTKYDNVRLLSSCASVPQVFFNTRFVGGLDGTLKELKKWEKKCGNSTSSIQKKYHEDVGKHPPVINESFDPVPAADETPKDKQPIPYCMSAAKYVELKDGTKTAYHDLIEKLKNSLTFLEEYTHKGNLYLDCCFTGKSAVKEFEESLRLSEEDAIAFGSLLLKQNVMYRVNNATTEAFDNKDESVFSLYCHKTPQILNSYCKWSTPVTRPASQIIAELDTLLRDIEHASTDEDGKLDHTAVRHNESYPMFQEAMCILQSVNIVGLDYNEMLAFALNLYTLMTRYAYYKVGVPTDDGSRLKLLNNTQFNIGGELFTFNDWVDGVLRGNRKTRFNKKKPFQENDARKKLSMDKTALDVRIHFAINTGPWLGTRSCLPFERYTAENIEKQLDIVSNVYFEDDFNLYFDRTAGHICLTKPIAWYRCDFCDKDSELKAAIQDHVKGAKLLELKNMTRENPKMKVKFVDIDRTVNSVNYLEFDDDYSKKGKGVKRFFRKSIQRFKPPKMHPNEIARLTALHNLNVLDSLPEERIDRLTLLVKEKFDIPLVLVSLVDENRQWFLSKQWFCKTPEASETPRDISFCGHAILGAADEIFHIQDATKDERFADNPLVTGELNLRFYAGCPLSVPVPTSAPDLFPVTETTTMNIGTLCLIDQKPRDFSEEEKVLLRKYAAEVRDEILNRPSKQNGGSVLAQFVES